VRPPPSDAGTAAAEISQAPGITQAIGITASAQLLVNRTITTTTLHPFNGLFSRTTWASRYQKGKTSLDLNETRDNRVLGWQWHQLDRMQTICTTIQIDNHTNTSKLNFYRPDALPDAQPTVSKL